MTDTEAPSLLPPYRCCSCGAEAVGFAKPCACVTVSGWRKANNAEGREFCIFQQIKTAPPAPGIAELVKEAARAVIRHCDGDMIYLDRATKIITNVLGLAAQGGGE